MLCFGLVATAESAIATVTPAALVVVTVITPAFVMALVTMSVSFMAAHDYPLLFRDDCLSIILHKLLLFVNRQNHPTFFT
jgi:hypothetical protein